MARTTPAGNIRLSWQTLLRNAGRLRTSLGLRTRSRSTGASDDRQRGGFGRPFENQNEPLKPRNHLGQRGEPQMQRCEYKSAGNERQSRWYACEQRGSLGLTKHRYQREAEKDVSCRKCHILPAAAADLQKQMLKCVHRLSPSRDMHEISKPALRPNRISRWFFARASYDLVSFQGYLTLRMINPLRPDVALPPGDGSSGRHHACGMRLIHPYAGAAVTRRRSAPRDRT
jgi:hypothetical protein